MNKHVWADIENIYKMNDIKEQQGTSSQHNNGQASAPRKSSPGMYVLDAVIIVAMGALLFWGISTQFSNRFNDVTRYQCYATVFWQGRAGLSALPADQCAFLATDETTSLVQSLQKRHVPSSLIRLVQAQDSPAPLHVLPPEYPLLTLVPFTVSLIVPVQWYQIAFALEMAVIAGILYLVLKRYCSPGAAIAFAFYLVLGNWATAEGRFDLIPAGLTLGAVILAVRARWNWAYVLLALATLFKFYPVVLLIPFLIAEQVQTGKKWDSWRKWQGWQRLAIFVGLCTGVMLVSLVLNVADTLSPFNYFVKRPTEIESLQASLLWLGKFVGYKTQEAFTYQSLNLLSPLANKVSLASTLLLAVGLLYTFWLQWRGKVDLPMASLLTLLLVMITGKVFSPQYLMWVTPLVAYVGKSNWKWLVSWGAVCALTTFIFPYMFDHYQIDPDFWVFLVRNGLIAAMVVVLFVYGARAVKVERVGINRDAA